MAPLLSFPIAGEDWPAGVHHVRATLEELRRWLGPADDAERRARSRLFFQDPRYIAAARLGLGIHDRLEEYIFADGRIHGSDRRDHARHFPAHLTVVRWPEIRLRAGEVWDMSARREAWPGLHYRDELYLLVRVDRLIVEPAAAVEVHGNVLTFDCGLVECVDTRRPVDEPMMSPAFEIKVLGTRYSAYSAGRTRLACDGTAGRPGDDGASSSANQVLGTPFGPVLAAPDSSRDGLPGTGGTRGGDGSPGENGGLSMLADIRLGRLEGFPSRSLRIFSQAGEGRPGKSGGCGGDGGSGGDGASPLDVVGGGGDAGRGGPGGDGGAGGGGGRGGNGGLASNIFVRVREQDRHCLDPCAVAGRGGAGGSAGPGGRGGHGGSHGEPGGASAQHGRAGRAGTPGAPGRDRPPARIRVIPAQSRSPETQG